MKRNLVIIPGAYTLRSRSKLAKAFYKIINYIIRITPHSDRSYKHLVKILKQDYSKVYFINYKRRLFNLPNKYNVQCILDTIKKTKASYDILAFSFGGHLAQKALKRTKNYPRKLLLVGSLNLDRKYIFPKSIKVINLQSKNDFFIKSSIFILSQKKGNIILDNAKNIYINNLIHTELETGKKIKSGKYKGLNTFELVRKLLKE